MTRLFEIKTSKTYIIKSIFECIKQYIKETNLIISKEGIKISTKDTSKTTLTYIKLDADKFESFYCQNRLIQIGIETSTFFKAIKNANKKEILTLYMDENKDYFLGVELTHAFVQTVKDLKIPLLSLEDDSIKLKDMEFDYVINMPTIQFQQIIKDIHILEGKIVDIQSIGNQLIFSSDDGLGEFSIRLTELNDINNEQKTLLEENGEKIEQTLSFSKSSDNIVQGKFKLSYFMNFIKASHLCDNMNIYLKNDAPIILEYFAADLGNIKFLSAPFANFS